MGYYNSANCYGPYRIDISSVSPFISSLTSVCLVKVSHMTDSVDAAWEREWSGNLTDDVV